MQSPLLYCTYHQPHQIEGICINKECGKQRLFCFLCLKYYHINHVSDLLGFQDFQKWCQNGNQMRNNIKAFISIMEGVVLILKQIMDIKIHENFNILNSTSEQIHYQAQNILLVHQIFEVMQEELTFINIPLSKLQKKCQKFKQKLKNVPESIQNLELQQQFTSLSFSFSEQYKNHKIQIFQNEAKTHLQGGFCLGEISIPKIGVSQFSIKISKCSKLYIGVGTKNQLMKADFEPKLSQIGHGCYLIEESGQVFSTQDDSINNTRSSFKILDNDTILVVINYQTKMIAWQKKQTSQSYSMRFNVQEILHPLFGLYWGSMIQIIT